MTKKSIWRKSENEDRRKIKKSCIFCSDPTCSGTPLTKVEADSDEELTGDDHRRLHPHCHLDPHMHCHPRPHWHTRIFSGGRGSTSSSSSFPNSNIIKKYSIIIKIKLEKNIIKKYSNIMLKKLQGWVRRRRRARGWPATREMVTRYFYILYKYLNLIIFNIFNI